MNDHARHGTGCVRPAAPPARAARRVRAGVVGLILVAATTVSANLVGPPTAAAAPYAGSLAKADPGSAEAGIGSTGARPGGPVPAWAPQVMPTPIDDDAFFDYPEPADIEELAPGALIRARTAVSVRRGLPPHTLYQFMFRSTDSHGRPVPATASLLVPTAQWHGDGPRPVVVDAEPIDGLGLECTTGYDLTHEQFHIDIPLPKLTPTPLERGYAVLHPDHEGPHMAYAAGILAGHIVLDSIRAMRNVPRDHAAAQAAGPAAGGVYIADSAVDPSAPVAITGYSGGAIASGWAGQLQPSYAPGITLVGVAAGGVPADLSILPPTMNGTAGTGVFMAAAFGLARENPELLANLNDFGQTVARSPMKDQCFETEEALGLSFLTIERLTHADVLDTPGIREVMARTRLGGIKPEAPVLLYAGSSEVFLGDEWIPESWVRALEDRWCALGANVVYEPVAGEHSMAGYLASPMVNDWLAARLEGVPQKSGCADTQWNADAQ